MRSSTSARSARNSSGSTSAMPRHSSTRTTTRSAVTSAKPSLTATHSLPPSDDRISTGPGLREVRKFSCFSSTPNSPSEPGSTTCSTGRERASPWGVTTISSRDIAHTPLARRLACTRLAYRLAYRLANRLTYRLLCSFAFMPGAPCSAAPPRADASRSYQPARVFAFSRASSIVPTM